MNRIILFGTIIFHFTFLQAQDSICVNKYTQNAIQQYGSIFLVNNREVPLRDIKLSLINSPESKDDYLMYAGNIKSSKLLSRWHIGAGFVCNSSQALLL